MFRAATEDDIAAICALLLAAQLPVVGVAEHIADFLVAEKNGRVVGAGGLERYGSTALLRSVVVSDDVRRAGIGTQICENLERAARRSGIETIYLLTETAPKFFLRRGYTAVERAEAPAEIVATEEFSTLCSKSALLMRRQEARGGGPLSASTLGRGERLGNRRK